MDGATIILLLVGAVGLILAGCAIGEEIADRWRCRQRQRMTRWQREAYINGPRGFEVKRSD